MFCHHQRHDRERAAYICFGVVISQRHHMSKIYLKNIIMLKKVTMLIPSIVKEPAARMIKSLLNY